MNASKSGGAAGLRFPPWSPASPGWPFRADRVSSAGPEDPEEHDLPDSSQYGDSSHP